MSSASSSYARFVDDSFERIFRLTPEVVALMGLSDLPAFADLKSSLNDYSLAGVDERRQLLEQVHASHRRHDRDRLSYNDQLTYDAFEFFLQYMPFEPWAGVRGSEFAWHSYPVRHHDGAPAELFNVLVNFHDVRDVADADAYLQRLSRLPRVFSDLMAALVERARRQLSPPKGAIGIVAAEIRSLVQAGAERSELLQSFLVRLHACQAFSGEQRQNAEHAARALVSELYQRSLPALAECLEQIAASASSDIGVWRLPQGDDFYRYCIERHTTLSMSPDEVFALGEQEVARLKSELSQDVAALGFDAGGSGAGLREAIGQALAADGAETPDDTAARAEIVAYYRTLVARAAEALRPYFGAYPRAHCEVRPCARHLEDRRTTTYYPASATGGYAGLLELCVLRELGKPAWTRNNVAYHETYPGHHLQLTIAQESPHLCLFRRTFVTAGYIEGWAKYAERLPFELGVDTERRYELQRKAFELISASNLMLDVGIHQRRWSRDYSIAFSEREVLLDRALAEYLVDRITVTPAQSLSYMLGLNTIRRLRKHAQDVSGAAFGLPEFHDRILGEGSLPLPILVRNFHARWGKAS